MLQGLCGADLPVLRSSDVGSSSHGPFPIPLFCPTMTVPTLVQGVREACYRALATVGKDAMHFR